MKRFRYIRILLLLLPMLIGIPAVLPLAKAMAQADTVYVGETVNLAIEPEPEGSTIKWDVYCDMTVNFAQTPGNCSSGEYDFVDGIDNQEVVDLVFNTPGEYMIKIEVWDPVMCTNNMEFLRLDVIESLPEVVLEGDSVCVGDPAVLTFNFTGTAPWSGTYTDGTNSWTFTSDDSEKKLNIPTYEAGTTNYWVTELTDANGTNNEPSESTEITVYPTPDMSRIYQVNK